MNRIRKSDNHGVGTHETEVQNGYLQPYASILGKMFALYRGVQVNGKSQPPMKLRDTVPTRMPSL